jgi:LysM domain
VRPGDSFWSIAAAQLSQREDPPADEERIARYWSVLVRANLAHLPVPGHPDLLFTGDRVQLPPTS